MIAEDFVSRRIAPLQAHKKPMWMYSGHSDPMRLHPCDHRPAVVDPIMGGLFINPDVPVAVAAVMRPLHQLNLAARLAVLEQMPTFTPLGLAGEEEDEGPMPMAKGPDAAESPYASDAEQGDAAAGAIPSAGGASSSKATPPTEEVFELSSSDDEKAEAGRQEPRTKAAHDRPAGEPTSAPLKRKAETAPEPGPRLLGVRLAWRGLTPAPRRLGKCS